MEKNHLIKKQLIGLFFALFSLCAWAEELPFVVIIPSYNNAAYVERTLQSVFMQKYSNFRVIYLDDYSTDNSPAIVESYIQRNNVSNKFTFIRNNKRQRKLKNIYWIIHELCYDNEIAVMVDCDDWLAHDQVFNLINRIYLNSDAWFIYGQDCPHPQDVAKRWGIPLTGNCVDTPLSVIQSNSFRNFQWVYMHIRTFPIWLFKMIKLEDLLAENVNGYQGQFYPSCDDYAMYYPMLEMAGRRIKFNPELVYYYNCGSPLNGFKIERQLQITSATEIRTRKKRYHPLEQPVINRLANLDNETADIVLFSSDINSTQKAMQHIRQKWTKINNITIITQAATDQYNSLLNTYSSLNIVASSAPAVQIPRSSNYCLFLHDTDALPDTINITESIKRLEQTFAHCYFYTNQAAGLAIQEITDNLSACKFSANIDRIKYNSTHMALYRSSEVLPLTPRKTIAQWFEFWQHAAIDFQKIGLINT